MADEIQQQIIANGSQALREYDKLQAKQVRLNRAIAEGNRQAKDYQRTMSKGFRDAGSAVGRAGGGLGTAGSQILGGAGMEGAFGRIAAGIGVAAVAFRALDAVINSRIATERLAGEATKSLSDALKGARERTSALGAGAITDAQARTALIAAGGTPEKAASLADQIGADLTDVTKGMTQILRTAATNADKDAAIREATLLARFGGISFSEAAGGVLSQKGSSALLGLGPGEAAAAFLRSKGERTTAAQLTATAPQFLEGTNLDERLSQLQRDRNRRTEAGVGQIESGQTFATQLQETVRLLSPAAAAMADWNKQLQTQIDNLQILARAQGGLGRLLSNAGLLFGGEGSFQNQAQRLQNVGGIATFGPNSPLRDAAD